MRTGFMGGGYARVPDAVSPVFARRGRRRSATGFAVAGFERLTIDVVFDDVVSKLPLVLLAFAPGVGLALAYLALRGRSPSTADEYIDAFHAGSGLSVRDLLAPDGRGSGDARAPVRRWVSKVRPSISAPASARSRQRRFPRFLVGADRRLLLVAGAAAGIAAIFKAPATGAVFALEVPYQDDLARHMLLPALVGSASGYLALVAVNGTAPLFPVNGAPPLSFVDLARRGRARSGRGSGRADVLVVVAARRRSCAPAVRRGYASRPRAARSRCCSPSVGSSPARSLVLTPGYDVLTWAIAPQRTFWLLAAILVLRCLATGAAVAGGGVGGLFVPLVVAGALLGRMFGVVVGHDSSLFLVVGVAAFLGAGYRVPLAAVMFVAETTGPSRLHRAGTHRRGCVRARDRQRISDDPPGCHRGTETGAEDG